MKNIILYSIALAVIISLWKCSSVEDDFVPPTTDQDTVITIQERMTVLEACKKKAAELNNLEDPEDRATYLAWLGTQPLFYSVGFAGEDLYAVFQDGRVVLFVRTPLDETTGGRVSSGRTSKAPANDHPHGRKEDLPKTKKVSLFNGLGKYFDPNCRDAIKGIFDEAKAGYQVYHKDATIQNLKSVADDAVFYIHTHGGAGNLHDKNGQKSIMALWTTERVSGDLDSLYKADLDDEMLCYMFATNDSEVAEYHYAITSRFVREYMSFGENCFIYLDACNGFNESIPGNVTFRERMIAKAGNQKATFVGWTGPTTAYRLTGQFVFDRLLGPYVGAAGVDVSQEDPFQRPFDLAQVFADMRKEHLGYSPNGAQLLYTTTLEGEVLLRPTIETLEVDEYTGTLIIKGSFPLDEGKVTVGDVAAVVTSWNPYGITCTIRETGEGSVGEVVVESAQGVKSNSVPLTEYIIKLNYSANDNGIVLSGVADLRIRADVHKRRSVIDETPKKPTYPDYSPHSGFIFNVKGSSAVYTVTGRKYDACNIGPCHVQFTESPTPKVGTIAYALPNQTSSPFFAMYNWGPEMKFVKISHLNINVTAIPLTFEERMQCPNLPVTVIPVEMPYDAWFGFPTHEIEGSLIIEIAENFNMRPGSWTKTINRAWSNCSGTGTFKQTVSWEVVVPKHAPTEKTAARDAGNVSGK